MEAHVRLEHELASWVGCQPEQVVACSSGTAALHLALEAFELPAGSGVVMPDYSMIACPRAASLAGLVPVFMDCNRDDLLLDPVGVQSLLRSARNVTSKQARVVMPVHVYGRRCAMEALHRVCLPYRVIVIEDMAEIHGVPPHSLTDAACWSFYRNKVVAGEEGGAVVFKNPERAATARSLRTLGFTERHDYRHIPRGHNYRMSSVHAELIRQSLIRFGENLAARRRVEKWYDEECPKAWRQPVRDVPWVYDLRIPGLIRDEMRIIVSGLLRSGIPARYGFFPMHLQTEYAAGKVVTVGGWNSVRASEEVFYLPILPEMTQTDCREIMQAVRGLYGEVAPTAVG